MTDYAKLAAELETPLEYDPGIIVELEGLSSFTGGTQQEAAAYLERSKGILIKAFRMARDKNLSPVQSMSVNYAISQACSHTPTSNGFPDLALSIRHREFAALEGHKTALDLTLEELFRNIQSSPLRVVKGKPFDLLLLLCLVEIQTNLSPASLSDTHRKLNQLFEKPDLRREIADRTSLNLSSGTYALCRHASTTIPNHKLQDTWDRWFYPNEGLADAQIRFVKGRETQEIYVANNASCWITNVMTP